MIGSIEVIGDDFRRWMNRPLCRVQVYTWQLACRIFPEDAPLSRFRALRPYRDDQTQDMRRSVAGAVRIARRGKITLPIYDEAKGKYIMTEHDHTSTEKCCPVCGLAPRQIQPEYGAGFEPRICTICKEVKGGSPYRLCMLGPLVFKMNIRQHFHEHNVLENTIHKAIRKAEGKE